MFDLPAGGLRIEGRVGTARFRRADLVRHLQGQPVRGGRARPIARTSPTGDVVLVPEGTYYIVSNYGDGNSVVRSDIRVQAGKLTDVTVTHRAAVIMLKLVSERGGEALANTAWSVLTPGGDVIKESIGAFPRVILAEGEYRAIARNDGKVFERPSTSSPASTARSRSWRTDLSSSSRPSLPVRTASQFPSRLSFGPAVNNDRRGSNKSAPLSDRFAGLFGDDRGIAGIAIGGWHTAHQQKLGGMTA